MTHTHTVTGKIEKLDEDRQIASGYAYVAKRANGDQVTDHSGEFVEDIEALEDAAHDFVLHSREGDVMHKGGAVASLVESVMVTAEKLQAMGVEATSHPTGLWVGFKVHDPDVWAKVKGGELPMFSIAGTGERETVNA